MKSMILTLFRPVSIVVFAFCIPFSLLGQASPFGNHKREADTTIFFIDLIKNRPQEIKEFQGQILHLLFNDSYAAKDKMILEVYGSNKKKVNEMELTKKYGENQYHLSKSQVSPNWKDGKLYFLIVRDDLGNKYETAIRSADSPETEIPVVDILYSASDLNCQLQEGNFIEYFGKIEGGKAPFQIEWTIVPMAEKVASQQIVKDLVPIKGYTTSIQVTFQPSYMVTLLVIDSCGNEVRKSLLISCQEKTKNKNNLMVQPTQSQPKRDN